MWTSHITSLIHGHLKLPYFLQDFLGNDVNSGGVKDKGDAVNLVPQFGGFDECRDVRTQGQSRVELNMSKTI